MHPKDLGVAGNNRIAGFGVGFCPGGCSFLGRKIREHGWISKGAGPSNPSKMGGRGCRAMRLQVHSCRVHVSIPTSLASPTPGCCNGMTPHRTRGSLAALIFGICTSVCYELYIPSERNRIPLNPKWCWIAGRPKP